ncbi:OmpA family protein [Roseobacteraceae bacterium NS-SX3]
MNSGFFKSTTALAVMVSLAAPLPGLAQAQGTKKFDLTQMSEAEIGDLVDRCRKRAERKARKLAKGEEVPEKKGPVAKFCAAYGEGEFDEHLPEQFQSATVLASVQDMTAGAEAEAAAETAEVAQLQEQLQQQAEAGAEVQAGAEAEAAAEAEQAPAQEEAAPETQAEAEVQAETQAQAEASASSEAETATSAEAIAQDLAQSQAGAADAGEAAPDNPEVTELDSQAQADALAEAEAETATSAAAASDTSAAEAEAEVVEETVTEETARSSDEEFATQVDENVQPEAQAQAQAGAQAAAQPAAPAAQPQADDDDGGLSDGQRAVLLGLGALAVGQLLNSGERVVSNTGDRAIVEQDGQYRVIKNDDALLRQPGSNVTTYKFKDGSTRTVVVRKNGVEVETIRAADGRVLRRTKILPDGRSVVLFDDTQKSEKVVVNELPQVDNNRRAMIDSTSITAENLAAALAAQQATDVDRRFSLSQIRNIDAVRRLVPEINVDSVNFETGSAVIRPQEAEELAALGNALRDMIEQNPSEVFLIEGHTDAVGAATYNLALSDRRAETVALALSEYFEVPPENMVVQGYGESDLAVKTLAAERANRRVAVRRITPLLMASGN